MNCLRTASCEQKLSRLGFSHHNLIVMSGEYDIFGLTPQRDIRKTSAALDTDEEKVRVAVSIIIPVFNRVEFTQKCLESLFQNTPDGIYELIVIDNASTDGTKIFLQALINRNFKVITNKENLGFAKACNQGARAASADYLLFLNNDTEPAERMAGTPRPDSRQ